MRAVRAAIAAWAVLAAGLAGGSAAQTAPAAPAGPDYDLDLTLDPGTGGIAVEAVITLSPEDAADGAGFLIGPTYVVSAVQADPGVTASVGPAPMPGVQRLSVGPVPDAQGPVRVRLSYAGRPSDGDGANAVTPGRTELSADSLWWPLPDVFNTRVTYRLTLRGLAPGTEVASPDVVTREGETVRIVRQAPSQDIAFTASPDFQRVVDGDLTILAQDPESDLLKAYRTNGAAALAFFEAWFGPLPTGRAVIAFPRRPSGSGYSRPGYLVVADVGTIDAANLWGRYGYVAHELSHAWWSSADFTSQDYWLVESTAEYSALRFMESRLGREPVEAILERKRPRAATGGAILGDGRPSNAAVYARGPLLLVALEQRIGRERMDALLGGLARRRVLTTADFLTALAGISDDATAHAFEAELRATP